MFPSQFEYHRPRSVDEALRLLTQYGDEAKLLAGGHSLLPAMKLRLASPRHLIDLGPLPDLRGVRLDGNTLAIGALTVHADVASSDLVRDRVPGLAEAAAAIGDVQVRNRGTIGGSVAHNDPGADFPVMLTALDASFVLQSPSGKQTVLAGEFFVDFFTTVLASNEIVTEVRVPFSPSGTTSAYMKLAHPASGYVVVSAAVLLNRDRLGKCVSARVALGGVDGKPFRAAETEATLAGQPLTPEVIAGAAAKAAEGSDPADDPYAGAEYKRHMATVLARKALEKATGNRQQPTGKR